MPRASKQTIAENRKFLLSVSITARDFFLINNRPLMFISERPLDVQIFSLFGKVLILIIL